MKIDIRKIRTDAKEKIRGENRYLQDLEFEDLYFARTLRSEISRAIIKEIKYPEIPKGYYIVDKNDVKVNEVKMIEVDMPVFAKDQVNYIGEPIALIVGQDKDVIIKIINNTKVIYEKLPPIYSMEESKDNKIQIISGNNNEFTSHEFSTGDISKLKNCKIFENEYSTTYQEQLYMEKQGVVGDYKDGELIVYGSMQCPYYIKNALMHSTGFNETNTRVIQADTGGAFGGKEEYPSLLACQVAAATLKIRKPVRLVFDRREDIMYTTKRHPSKIKIKSYVENNKIIGIDIDVDLDAGPYIGLSDVVLQRALFTLNGAYQIENVNIKGQVYATNNVFTGAFRGFGAPQTMFALEQHFNQVAKKLKIDPFDFKKSHFVKQGQKTVTNGVYVEEIKLDEIADKLEILSNYKEKIKKEDSKDSYYGVGVSFVPHGGGFTGDGEAEHIKAKIKLRKNKDNTVDIFICN
jgi:CO/xanthine dehydrogenase Mo-binding subunit